MRRAVAALVPAALAAGLLTALPATAPAAPAPPEPAVAPVDGSFAVRGAGYGHGWGMSQYGAYGAARQGRTWQQILDFSYPGTTRGLLPAGTALRVWVTADRDGDLQLAPRAGLRLTSGAASYTLPSGDGYRRWRVVRSGSGYRLSYLTPTGRWRTQATPLGTATWTARTSGGMVAVVLGGTVREYRGTVSLIRHGSGARTVNRVAMESYLRSVVPAEMPAGWHPEALAAQAVAARSYAARLAAGARTSGYDVCDTTACQVYAGVATTRGGTRTVREHPRTDAAVTTTARTVVRYRGAVALTQFASSNGGARAQGDFPYLSPGSDPYDGLIRSQAWTLRVSADAIARRWPAVGRVRSLQVVARDGSGAWGGRVTRITIVGSTRSQTVDGTTFQYAFRMRSTLFTLSGSPGSTPSGAGVRPGRAYAAFPRSYDGASRVDLALVGRDGVLRRFPLAAGTLGTPTVLGTGFRAYSHVIGAGDWNGDGYADVVVRNGGRLLLLRGGSTGRLARGVDLGVRSDHRMLTGVGDLDGDRFPDLAGVDAAGRLVAISGDGRTGVRAVRVLSGGWAGREWLRGVGDVVGDARPDLVSRSGGTVSVHRGIPGGFARPVALGGSWSGVATITGVGDVDGDGRADLVARTTTGRLQVYERSGDRWVRDRTLPGAHGGTRFAT